jgi:peroxiredoxin
VPVETGQEAPDFTLEDQDGNDVLLSSANLATPRERATHVAALAKRS